MKVTTDACLFGAWVASLIKKNREPGNILDIGTGTGLLSLMLAQATKSTRIDAVEPNEAAFQEAKDNFSSSPWGDRMHIRHQSIQDFSKENTYDLIICNPPFFTDSQKGRNVEKNQALHVENLSPSVLLDQVTKLLAPSGSFFVLYPPAEMKVFEQQVSSDLYPIHRVYVKNSEGSQVFRTMTTFQTQPKKPVDSELIIRAADGRYTAAFWALLSDYYLEYNNPLLST